MPSHLRIQTSFDTQSTQSYYPTPSTLSPPQKKQKMSLTQTYRVASSARSKLGREAARPDHNLRLLVGHANLLDTLMIELADAEREQESWFNETVRKAGKPEAPRHIQWIDSISEEDEEEESDSDSDLSEEEMHAMFPRPRSVSPPPTAYSLGPLEEEDEDEEDIEDFDNDAEHALTRVESHPPALVHEDSESDDESMPPSPPVSTMQFSGAVCQSLSTSPYFEKAVRPAQPDVISDDFISRSNNQLIAAF